MWYPAAGASVGICVHIMKYIYIYMISINLKPLYSCVYIYMIYMIYCISTDNWNCTYLGLAMRQTLATILLCREHLRFEAAAPRCFQAAASLWADPPWSARCVPCGRHASVVHWKVFSQPKADTESIAMERSTIFHGKIHYFYGHVQ